MLWKHIRRPKTLLVERFAPCLSPSQSNQCLAFAVLASPMFVTDAEAAVELGAFGGSVVGRESRRMLARAPAAVRGPAQWARTAVSAVSTASGFHWVGHLLSRPWAC